MPTSTQTKITKKRKKQHKQGQKAIKPSVNLPKTCQTGEDDVRFLEQTGRQ
jgi:hypothetical protein